jgi:hypothetical protein
MTKGKRASSSPERLAQVLVQVLAQVLAQVLVQLLAPVLAKVVGSRARLSKCPEF